MSDSLPVDPDVPSYDFIVIGGGSAGYAAARTASGLGLKTALGEGGKDVGGLCILRGCMPSKTMIESANRFVTLRRAAEFGLRAENIRVIGPEVQARKRRIIGEFADYRRGQLEHGKFDYIRGLARFVDDHTLRIIPPEGDDAQTGPHAVRSKTFLIATGSQVADVPVPGLCDIGCLDSDTALELEHFPASIIILGAGAIGLEAAHQFAGLGTQVTVIQRGDHIMRDADKDIGDALQKALTHQGVRFECGSHLLRADRDDAGQKRVWFECGGVEHSVSAEEVFFALGRIPCTHNLEVFRAGVETSKKGAVRVTPDQRSTAPHIFAAGDVTGPYEIVHIAIQQAELAARNAARQVGQLGTPVEEIDYRLKLFVLFTDPQMAQVGLTEKEASEQGRNVSVASYPFADHGKAMVRGETEGMVKLVADYATGEIIGASAVGPEVGELIHEVVVAMHFRATAADLAAIPHYHPTLSEIWTYPAEEIAEMVQAAGPISAR